MSLKDTDVRTPGNAAIAKKWKLSLTKVRHLVAQGAKHEKEHNTNEAKAEEVARDHINERPDYYSMLKKAEKSKIKLKEETGVSGVRGLGFVSGDPASNPINQYINTNSMSYEDENGNKLDYIKRQHADLHNKGLGYNFFDPTKIKSSSNFMNEGTDTSVGMGGDHSPKGEGDKYLENNVKNTDRDAGIREKHADGVHHSLHGDLGFNTFRHTNVKSHSNRELTEARAKVASKINELGGLGEPNAYIGLSDPRKSLEEGPKLDKAKKIAKTVAVTGMTAANMYTMGDAISQHKPRHQTDMVRAATALPGAAGWGASAVHYGKKGYDLAKDALKKKKGNMEEEKKMSNPCWKGYKAYGMKKKNGKEVPNCVPVEEDMDESAAWQRSAGKDPEGGLNRKGIASYRREHPGSKLSMAVTTEPSKLKPGSKAANRRKSFCARMGGMKGAMKDEKGRPTRKALALRKWNCEEETKYPETAERGIYEKAPPGDKYERMVRHIKAGYAKDGLTKKEKGIAFATSWKAKNKEMNEASADLANQMSDEKRKQKKEYQVPNKSTMSTRDFSHNTRELYTAHKHGKAHEVIGRLSDTHLKMLHRKGTGYQNPEHKSLRSTVKYHAHQEMKGRGLLEETQIDEISAELVGKVSNARFWRGEAPSKTLTRAINKKFIESGKKKETKKAVKENSKDKDWDEATGPMGKGDMAEQTPSHLHLNKPDTAYAPGAAGTTKTIYEETTMENQNLINEAIENILENDLVTMKENLMTALQEKAQEKLEEKKKAIAANYFAQ